jgi:hypothetical protein
MLNTYAALYKPPSVLCTAQDSEKKGQNEMGEQEGY